MKARKARKRLRRVEDLLSTVIKKFDTSERSVHDLLGTAKSAVSGALTSLPRSAKKPPVSEAKASAAKSRESAAGNKRPTAAKTAAAGQSVSRAG